MLALTEVVGDSADRLVILYVIFQCFHGSSPACDETASLTSVSPFLGSFNWPRISRAA